MIYVFLCLLVAATIGLSIHAMQVKARRKQRSIWGEWPVRKVELDAVDSIFAKTAFGPNPASLAQIVGTWGVLGGTSDTEAWILAALAKKSSGIFEFGTCTGKTTYLLAVNAPAQAKIATITLAPEQRTNYIDDPRDDAASRAAALKESQFAAFYYTGTPEAGKITQLFGDSKAFDETPYHRTCDLIFIDGSHAYSYVVSDTEKALKMIKPGGLILWHDYKGPRVAAGVFQALNEYNNGLKLMHIAGTTLVAYRAP